TVPLREGGNLLVALARKANGNTGSASIEVTRDVVAPIVRIQSPANGFVSAAPSLAVSGQVNDSVTGGIPTEVRVNGRLALVSGGAFLLDSLPLQPGDNTLDVVAFDAAGNSGADRITVRYQPSLGRHLEVVSGNGQLGALSSPLPQPLVVAVLDAAGNPVPAQPVSFRVSRNSGSLAAQPGDSPRRTLQLYSDANGQARAFFTLGDSAGAGTQRVTVSALGAAGELELCATGLAGEPAKIVMTMGDNQRGAVGRPLPVPLEALVLDSDGNPVPGVLVRFQVEKGGGNLDGAPTLTRTTGLDGRARVAFTLGFAPGIAAHVVSAAVEGLDGLPASFTESALVPGDPAQTRFSGVVVDNSLQPIPGAEVSILGAPAPAITDEQGRFTLTQVPVGLVHLHIDPSGSPRPETFPPLAFETVTVAGVDNQLAQPIALPVVDTAGSRIVGGDQDVTLTMAGVEGASLTVFAHSVTCPDGSHTCRVALSQVQLDKVPMAPPAGSMFLPPAWTVQPHGVTFDPPARVTVPNNGLPPGRVVEIEQFDHELNRFISVGQGTVSEDGSLITSDPGFGVQRAGWG
ncbi:MAG TPA: carboxypeptidase regulatory-like domain-containing protein, partial [Thermoanaerobaculia bacterium]|nr:carboxypeptidase regulatory-like domain-containing protein [Thermoanaerobaculia bacterium]